MGIPETSYLNSGQRIYNLVAEAFSIYLSLYGNTEEEINIQEVLSRLETQPSTQEVLFINDFFNAYASKEGRNITDTSINEDALIDYRIVGRAISYIINNLGASNEEVYNALGTEHSQAPVYLQAFIEGARTYLLTEPSEDPLTPPSYP